MSAGRGALPGAPGAAGALCSPTAAGTRSAPSWTVVTGSAAQCPDPGSPASVIVQLRQPQPPQPQQQHYPLHVYQWQSQDTQKIMP